MAQLQIYTCDFCEVRMDEPALVLDMHGPAMCLGEMAPHNCGPTHACEACAPRIAVFMSALRAVQEQLKGGYQTTVIMHGGGTAVHFQEVEA